MGVYEFDNSQGSEIWGPVERMLEALDRPVYNRVIARVQPDLDFAMATEQLEEDPRLSFSITRQSEYLAAQTTGLSTSLLLLSIFLTIIMGSAAVIGTMNTMLATVASRTHEIGILLAIGYSRIEVFLAFLLESAQGRSDRRHDRPADGRTLSRHRDGSGQFQPPSPTSVFHSSCPPPSPSPRCYSLSCSD